MRGRQVLCTLERVIIVRNVNMGMKKGMKNSIILPTPNGEVVAKHQACNLLEPGPWFDPGYNQAGFFSHC